MEMFDEVAVKRVNLLAARAREGIAEVIGSTGVRACVTGGGSLFRVHFKASPPTNYREAFATPEESRQLGLLLDHLFEQGFLMINTCTAAVSTVTGEPEIDGLVAAIESGFRRIQQVT